MFTSRDVCWVKKFTAFQTHHKRGLGADPPDARGFRGLGTKPPAAGQFFVIFLEKKGYFNRRWSPRGRPWPLGRPRGHILKSLALASKPQVLENCPALGSRTALFLNRWNLVGKRQKPCGKSAKTIFLISSSRDRLKKNFEDFFFGEHLRLCPWSLALASRGSVLGLGLEIFLCPWPRTLCPRLHLWFQYHWIIFRTYFRAIWKY